MFGRERFNAGVLIEPNPNYSFDSSDAAKLADYRNTIWYCIAITALGRVSHFYP